MAVNNRRKTAAFDASPLNISKVGLESINTLFFWEVLYIEEELHFLNAVTVDEKERNDADITAIETKYQMP